MSATVHWLEGNSKPSPYSHSIYANHKPDLVLVACGRAISKTQEAHQLTKDSKTVTCKQCAASHRFQFGKKPIIFDFT